LVTAFVRDRRWSVANAESRASLAAFEPDLVGALPDFGREPVVERSSV
jgi:hypothetical protein